MAEASAKIIADSISQEGHRLVTFEATCWRPVLAEQNTHCVLSRNSASSRAIPVARMLERFEDERLDNPIVWPREQKGMQGGSELEGKSLQDAKRLWWQIQNQVQGHLDDYIRTHTDPAERLHKSLLNRWLEPGLWQTQIISATQWDGYFWQRDHKDAEPHIRAMAKAMHEAMEAHEPRLLKAGEWHLPYWHESGGHESDYQDALDLTFGSAVNGWDPEAFFAVAKQVSVARCARVSYLTQDGIRDIQEDLRLYGDLTSNRVGSKNPPHASPLEHIATPWAENVQHVTMPNGKVMGPLPKLGKFVGWWQHRHEELEF